MIKPEFLFGDIVVIEESLIGVVVKSWANAHVHNPGYHHEVYVREFNSIKDYSESEMERYRIRHKHLNDEELQYQN